MSQVYAEDKNAPSVRTYSDDEIAALEAEAAELEYMTFGGWNLSHEERQAAGLEIPAARIRAYIGASETTLERSAAEGDYAAMWILLQQNLAANDLKDAVRIARNAAVIHEIPFLLELVGVHHMEVRSDPATAAKWIMLAAKLTPDDLAYANYLAFLGERINKEQAAAAAAWADGEMAELETKRIERVGTGFSRVRRQ